MGKPTTSAEQIKAWHKKKENRNKENERKKKRYHVKEKELTEEECDKTEEYDRLRKEKSCKNQSRQRIQGIKLKDKNRKRKQCHSELYNNTQTLVNTNSSIERVRKHRQKKTLVINLPFTPKNTKVQKAAEVIKNSLPRTPKSKPRTLINVNILQSPITKMNIISNTYSHPILHKK